MAKNYLRKIVVDGEVYLWYRVHRHHENNLVTTCVEILTVFRQTSRKNPLRIRFRRDDNLKRLDKTDSWVVGYPEDGILWICGTNRNCVFKLNLNRPKVVAELIRLAHATVWNEGRATTVDNGLQFLDEHISELRQAIDPDGLDAIPDPDNFSVQMGVIYRDEGR